MWTPTETLAASLAGTSVVMLLMWLLQLRTGNAGVVDAAWALSIGALAALASTLGEGWIGRRLALALVMGLWSARLGTYLIRDRVIGKAEDGRYSALRREWGASVRLRMLWFFQVQAMAAVFFALPAFIASANPAPAFSSIEGLALVLWCAAFVGEIVADRQLERFKADPANRGRSCQDGLWRSSRSPLLWALSPSSALWPCSISCCASQASLWRSSRRCAAEATRIVDISTQPTRSFPGGPRT